MLEKIATNTLSNEDWKENRPKYLSRVHENVRTRNEFQNLYKNIESNSAISKHLKPREQKNILKSVNRIRKRIQNHQENK